MKLNVKSKAFREVYESTRARWGLPPGEHAQVTRHTAVCLVSYEAQKMGHRVQIQGMALECYKCGASCSVDPLTLEVVGSLVEGKCWR